MSADPTLPKAAVDAHHHIWRRADLPWLLGPSVPRIFGAYDAIKRDYPMDEYLEDLTGTGIAKSVYVQANWAPNWAADEAAWVQRVAERTGWPHAIVGFADFTVSDVRPQLDRLAAQPLMRGVRQQLHWHETPAYRFAGRADLGSDPMVQRNIAHLAERGWVFELQLFAAQAEHGVALAEACPDVTFVLQHALMLEDLSAKGRDQWESGLRRLAACPNVICKLSGLGTFVHRVDAALITEIVATATDAFGVKRCLWGSNFPIEKLWTAFGPLLAAHTAATNNLTDAARRAIYRDTATRVYRL
ncbi:MAG: amidohydrolase family protein [Pseudomonadota bacterium]